MVAVLDTSECMHVVDIRSQTVLDTIDLSIVGIVYQSSFYKGLTTSRATSQAMVSSASSSKFEVKSGQLSAETYMARNFCYADYKVN